ncbi:MAG TPA: ATP-binding protein [Ramlibacter sp.]|nr:ATP-binding protein [Ramlibacter sp.]
MDSQHSPRPAARQPEAKQFAALASVIYLVLGLAWIATSDHLVSTALPSLETATFFQTLKGTLFVLVTSAAIFLLLRRTVGMAQRNATLETAVADHTAQLQAANAALECFTSSVAHDLRAPLGRLAGFAQLLHEATVRGDTTRVQHCAARIMHNARNLDAMIQGMLELSRLERDTTPTEDFDTAQCVRQIVDEHRVGTDIQFHIGALPVIQAQPILRQVWENLIANAVKYSSRAERPRVTVGSCRQDRELVFTVSDNGVGFDPIVEMHGGRVWATGTPGAGATFCFALPR